jgi:hypothetical protein
MVTLPGLGEPHFPEVGLEQQTTLTLAQAFR